MGEWEVVRRGGLSESGLAEFVGFVGGGGGASSAKGFSFVDVALAALFGGFEDAADYVKGGV